MKKILSIAAVLIVIVCVFAYGYKSFTAPFGTSDAPIKIGFIGNLTGQYSDYTVNFKDGVELAREQYSLNAKKQVEIIYEDDGFDSKKGVSAFQKLTNIDKVTALINVTTPTIGAIKPEINTLQIPTVQFGIEPDGSQDDFVFTVYPGGVDTEKKVAEASNEYLKSCQRPLLIYSNVDAMISQKDQFKNGYKGAIEEYMISSKNDILKNDALEVSKNMKPDCIVVETTPLDGAWFIKYYLSYSKTDLPQWFFGAVFFPSQEEYKKILGSQFKSLDNAIVPVVETYASDEFKKLFKDKYGKEASVYSEFGFDAFNVLIQAYDRDTAAWKNNIQKTDLRGASSHITYTETGSVNPVIKVMRMREIGKVAE